MRHLGSASIVLTLVLAGCGGAGEDNGAAVGNNQAAPASSNGSAAEANAAAPGAAPAGNASASAETPAGPCPFATRGWRATLFPASPGEQAVVAVIAEIRADSSGRPPTLSAAGEQHAPMLVVELLSEPRAEPQANRDWQQSSAVFDRYTPDFTQAAVRCGGVEIARVPIREGEE